MARIITENKELIQSYIFTAAKYDFTAYEKRIMYRLVECAQKEIEGIKIKDNMHKIKPVQLGREITLPTASILRNEKDENYTIAKKAFLSLCEKVVIYEDADYWTATQIIAKPKISKKEGTVTFLVFDEIWNCILDFTKGYRKYELAIAMKFKSVYAMRFYELMSGQKKPLFVLLEGPDGLRERFCLQGKYERVNDFKRYVIDVAKKELDEHSPYSFVAKEEKEGRKVIGWTLFPVFYENREDSALQEQARMAKVTARLQLGNNVYDYLKFSFDFKSDEINKNKKILIEGQNRIPDFVGFLGELKKGARLAENPKGYVIGAIKIKLKEI
ncbi:replication initiation protein [Phocaeicola massiliensis]|jgi:hypothetical protein|uniref:replication initiation protein n=1 Tax=Bacteroidaceae TaxID=815 RepID=UPI00179A1D4B|nr:MULTISPECIES: replication initiation protein [Bacteroidaceae]EFH6622083.1 RepB family plasmid replication initiator protein [Escherichia coli]MBU9883737.1 replication initiation protein [Bacteroides sp. MSK.20.82]MBV3499802.1 replication initiation protein [Phocaeicola massiliensis]